MKCQARLNAENETRFRSGGERNLKGNFNSIYQLVAWCQFLSVILMDYKSKTPSYLPCPFKKHFLVAFLPLP